MDEVGCMRFEPLSRMTLLGVSCNLVLISSGSCITSAYFWCSTDPAADSIQDMTDIGISNFLVTSVRNALPQPVRISQPR